MLPSINMNELEKNPPDKLSAFDNEQQNLQDLLVKRTRQAEIYERLSRRAQEGKQITEERLQELQPRRVKLIETLVFGASRYRRTIRDLQGDLQNARKLLELNQIEPSLVAQLEEELHAFSELPNQVPDLKRGLALLEAREQEDLESSTSKKEEITSQQTRRLQLEEPPNIIKEDEGTQFRTLIRDTQNGLYEINGINIQYRANSMSALILNALPANPDNDPLIGLTRKELEDLLKDMQSPIAALINQINSKFKKELELDDFRIIVGLGGWKNIRYSINAAVRNTDDQENTTRIGASEIIAIQTPRIIQEIKAAGSSIDEIQALNKQEANRIYSAYQESTVQKEIGLTASDINILASIASTHKLFVALYEEKDELKIAHSRISALSGTDISTNYNQRAQETADAFMKIGKLLSLNREEQNQIISLYDEDNQALLLWLLEDREKFRTLFSDSYYSEGIVRIPDVQARTLLLAQYRTLRPVSSEVDPKKDAPQSIREKTTIEVIEPSITESLINCITELAQCITTTSKYSSAEIKRIVPFSREWESSFYERAIKDKIIQLSDNVSFDQNFLSNIRLQFNQIVLLRMYELYNNILSANSSVNNGNIENVQTYLFELRGLINSATDTVRVAETKKQQRLLKKKRLI